MTFFKNKYHEFGLVLFAILLASITYLWFQDLGSGYKEIRVVSCLTIFICSLSALLIVYAQSFPAKKTFFGINTIKGANFADQGNVLNSIYNNLTGLFYAWIALYLVILLGSPLSAIQNKEDKGKSRSDIELKEEKEVDSIVVNGLYTTQRELRIPEIDRLYSKRIITREQYDDIANCRKFFRLYCDKYYELSNTLLLLPNVNKEKKVRGILVLSRTRTHRDLLISLFSYLRNLCNYISSFFIICLYLILALPSQKPEPKSEEKTEEKSNRIIGYYIYKNYKQIWGSAIMLLLLLELILRIIDFINPLIESVRDQNTMYETASGILACLGMFLLAGRLDSHYLREHYVEIDFPIRPGTLNIKFKWVIYLLTITIYIYAAIQPLYPFIDEFSIFSGLIWLSFFFKICLVVLLYIIISASKNLSSYLQKIRSIYKDHSGDLKKFLQQLELLEEHPDKEKEAV